MMPLLVMLLLLPMATGQVQPLGPPDVADFVEREDLTDAAPIDGAQRILRFAQVSDAHVIDDDAPYPLRQGILNQFIGTFAQAERPQEEYTDEVLLAMIESLNRQHAQDGLDFVINTGDNIDNQLENELMRFIDLFEGTLTTTGPFSGLACAPDGQSTDIEDDDNDVETQCTHLPDTLPENRTGLHDEIPWFSAFGNHDGLIQGNIPVAPGTPELADQYGRYFIRQEEYVGMHFEAGAQCVGGQPAGQASDDLGHGYGFAGARLCDEDPDNDGYYSFSMRGVHFIVLDTINDDFFESNQELQGLFPPTEVTLGRDIIGGYAEGAIDPTQFAWMINEIESNTDQLVILMSHHTVNSMFAGEFDRRMEKHGGLACEPPICMETVLKEAGYATGGDVEAELAKHPHVVAWVGGHTHQHLIQAKSGFWNIETSSLLDLPQEARTIELWAVGDKAFLRLERVEHEDEARRAVAATDSLADPETAAGTPVDRDVLLWIDVPAGVNLVPQPSLPRSISLFATGPAAAEYGVEYPFEVAALDVLLGTNVSGLNVTVEIGYPDDGFQIVIPAGTVLGETTPGHYGISFTPESTATHFATVTATDASGLYPERTQVVSIIVTGEPPKEATPAALPFAALAIALLVRQKR